MTVNRAQFSPSSSITSPSRSNAKVTTPAAQPAAAAPAGWGAKSGAKLPATSANIADLGLIAAKAKDGTLNPKMVEEKLGKLAAVSDSESQQLWTAPGQSKRNDLIAAFNELAKSAPNARMPANPVNGYRATVKEQALSLQFANAQALGDKAGMKKFAGELAKQFPSSPSAKWMSDVASR